MDVSTLIWISISVIAIAIVTGALIYTLVEILHSPRLDSVSRAIWLVALLVFSIGTVFAWLWLSPRGPVTIDEATGSAHRPA